MPSRKAAFDSFTRELIYSICDQTSKLFSIVISPSDCSVLMAPKAMRDFNGIPIIIASIMAFWLGSALSIAEASPPPIWLSICWITGAVRGSLSSSPIVVEEAMIKGSSFFVVNAAWVVRKISSLACPIRIPYFPEGYTSRPAPRANSSDHER